MITRLQRRNIRLCDTFIYYGLSLFSTKLTGDRFINFALSGAVELPAYFIAPPLLNMQVDDSVKATDLGKTLGLDGSGSLVDRTYYRAYRFLPSYLFPKVTMVRVTAVDRADIRGKNSIYRASCASSSHIVGKHVNITQIYTRVCFTRRAVDRIRLRNTVL